MTAPNPAWRGDRRLQLTLAVSDRLVQVTAISLLEGPAVQRPSLSGTFVVRVDVAGQPALIEAFDDPMVTRGVSRPEIPGHSYIQHPTGTVVVEVPLTRESAVSDLVIRAGHMRQIRSRPTDPDSVGRLFDKKTRGFHRLPDLTLADLVSHPDWVEIGQKVGVAPETRAAFEIYRDRKGLFRWRLRRPDGEIVADSGGGYADRLACEKDLRWVRSFGLSADIRSLDIESGK
jgi:uncharacterized protein YegP (UPF0339 family)